jgi:Caspase domain/N-acetylmuramoyl-L-alanine amidase
MLLQEFAMLGFVTELSSEQFAALLRRDWARQISAVHIHHTWRPRASQWRGLATVEAMRRVHMQTNGWSDIAQHITIGPDGSVWSGRHLDRSPASAVGHNGSASDGPLMIELVGDFDTGQEKFEGAQAQATYRCVAAICKAFELPLKNIRFHREFTSQKTCPGSSLSLDAFRAEVEKALKALPKSQSRNAHASAYLQGAVAPLSASRAVDEPSAELRYDAAAENAWGSDQGARGIFGPSFSATDIALFNQHVVNTSAGRLSNEGKYTNSQETIQGLVGHIANYITGAENPKIVLYAHGGLVSESSALESAKTNVRWWLANGVYPVYFVWETGLNESFKKLGSQEESRGLTDLTDRIIEASAGTLVGRPAWKLMKDNARHCSTPTLTGPDEPGGAYYFCSLLVEMLGKHSNAAELHAVGHSAGSIFHCEMLPMLDRLLRENKTLAKKGPAITSMALLAPACRVDVFKSSLMPLVETKRIAKLAHFTMNARAELDDTVAGIYRKSLLHFVRNACEINLPQILGLEESIRPDTVLSDFFDPSKQPGNAHLLLSPTNFSNGSDATKSIKHGDFDNDPPTMNAVLRRILNISDDVALTPPMIEQEKKTFPFMSSAERSTRSLNTSGNTHALCIGIDTYPIQPLSGCVADARLWAKTFGAMGIQVHELLLNEKATKRNIVDAWRRVSAKAQAGDTLVIQYAGHGTQAPDKNGDELDSMDEAWVPIDGMNGDVLLDDEIGGLIDTHTPAGVQVVIFSDSCHSGSTTRAKSNGGGTARFVKLIDNQAFLRGFERASKQWARELNSRSTAESQGPEILFSGCQDHQYSFEDGGHGRFTLAAVAALQASASSDTYRKLADRILEKFDPNPAQVPNFTANKDRAAQALFGALARTQSSTSLGATDAVEQRLRSMEAQLAEIKELLRDIR